MAKTPYLYRRGNNFYFRVTVPKEIRPFVGCREIVRTLHTQQYNDAVPLALSLGSNVKSLFNRIRSMSDKKDYSAELKELFDLCLEENKQNTAANSVPEIEGLTLQQRVALWRRDFKNSQKTDGLREEAIEQKLQQLAEIKLRDKYSAEKDKAVRDAVAMILNTSDNVNNTPLAQESIKLSEAIDDYVEHYKGEDSKTMLGKIQQQLPMFLELVGDKLVNELTQTDIIDYFAAIQMLPKDWSYKKTKGLSLRAIIADNEGGEGLSEATVKKSYRAVLSGFIETQSVRKDTNGFPRLRTDKGVISYRGNRPVGYGKQRAMKDEELKRLFEGEEMREFASDRSKLHMYWLPHIGLHTGARINEICQLNPQSDILEHDGIWYFRITEATDDKSKDELVHQSVKNHKERNVPIHSQLIKLGILDYIQWAKKKGHKRLFTAWIPVNGKASAKAADWFQDHIRATDLRKETPHKMLVGFHAFRHTFMNHANNNDIQDETALTGHDDPSTSSVVKGYRGQKALPKLQSIMEKFNFGLKFIKPAKP